MIIKKIIFSIFYFFFITVLIANDYKDIIKETYSNRKLDTIEGLWQKSYANQGSTGCITMFYKVKQNSFNQIHIDSCFVVDKITGKHKKIDENSYQKVRMQFIIMIGILLGAHLLLKSQKN